MRTIYSAAALLFSIGLVRASSLGSVSSASSASSSFTNPVLPGWHSDPSLFPGAPVYASKNLLDWKLASNALHDPAQLSVLGTELDPSNGLFAATLRERNGTFYLITIYLGTGPFVLEGLIFSTTNPYDSSSWSQPVIYGANGIDPDLFWDDDGQVYLSYTSSTAIYQSTINLETGATGSPYNLWNGSGGRNPEGPHMFKKDGYYYLLIAEGGTELNHSATIARANSIAGPYTSDPANPFLTNRGTDDYFQTVGHADLFEDASGNWWGVALATRCGPEYVNYPMGRETVLYPVTWKRGQWPTASPVMGRMTGWKLPNSGSSTGIPGTGAFVEDPENVTFSPGSAIPSHFVYWRYPPTGAFTVAPKGHASALQLTASRANLTGDAAFTPTEGRTIAFSPVVQEQEAGVTVFLTQDQHIDLGIVLLPTGTGKATAPYFRFRTTVLGKDGQYVPPTVTLPIRKGLIGAKILLQVQAVNETHYLFSAGSAAKPQQMQEIGYAPATVVTGGTGPFTGTLLGVYATRNGGNGTANAYVSAWKYTGIAQAIGDGEWSPPIA